ncbi:GNAT family N-acetyltransferase [Wenxinia saemankumensis]|uniref:Acetyltransferase, GNAT family n=1 Tax=Wenxinia saemankumensis TaxID=1447782 RepID=A0A1M6AST5_9RHOB|nr:GNAT family N-acetyltransferase [Wenxinia saemankumensis]SHI39491.1 Acetyltransferase, GNAT family [Wenxinia saemankumensis]
MASPDFDAPPLTLRRASLTDLAALDDLLARAYGSQLAVDYPPSLLVTAVPLIARAQPRLLTSGSYFVVEDAEGVLRGAGGWTATLPGQDRRIMRGRGNVRHVVTDTAWTRRGIGRRIVERAMEGARKAGMTWMHCTATRTAVPFYTALGFRALRGVTVPLAPGIAFPAIEMRAELQPGP